MNISALSTTMTKLLGTLVLGFLLLLVPLNNVQFVLFGILPLGVFLFLYKLEVRGLSLRAIDLPFFAFVATCFLSFIWANNPSLIWTQAFGWLGLGCVMLAFRTMTNNYDLQPFLQKIFALFFVIIMVHHLAAVQFEVEVVSGDWNQFMAKNGNQTACYLLALLPFLLYYKSINPFVTFLKLTSVILIVNLLGIVNAKGAFVALLGFVTVYFWMEQRKFYFLSCLLLIAISAVLYLVQVFNPGAISFLPVPLDEPRATLVGYSFELFNDSPLLGVGLGNWHTLVYSSDLSALPSFNNPDNFIRHNSYNLYFQILSELGTIGALSFAAFVVFFFKGLRKLRVSFTSFEKAAVGSIVIYFVCSYFFSGVNINDFNFSGTELLAFISLGIVTNRFSALDQKVPNWLMIVLSLLVICWFSYSLLSWHNYQEYRQLKKSNDITASITKLEDLYSPVFKTKNGYKNNLNLELAELYQISGKQEQALLHFQTVINKEPYNCEALHKYAEYLLDSKINTDEARSLIGRIEDIQSNSTLLKSLKSRLKE